MQQIYSSFEGFTDDCKVWVYLADRKLESKEIFEINQEISVFVSSWETHGKKLRAAHALFFDHFVVFVVDEKEQTISGCSIDKSFHLMKHLGEKFQVDFFKRMNVLCKEGEGFAIQPYHLVKKKTSISYFNPIISNLGELRQNWIIEQG